MAGADGSWSNQIVNQIIIVGTAGQLLVYSPVQAAGDLSAAVSGAATTDQFGNHILAGVSSYGTSFAVALTNGAIGFYTGTETGGWTLAGQVAIDASGDLFLLPASGRSVTTNNNTLDNGTGGATVAGILNVNGSGMTVGNGSNASLTLNPKMATPNNLAAVIANTATLAQTQTCLGNIVTSMQNRGMVN